MTACPDKVAYLSEHQATNAATLYGFVRPDCPGIEVYDCPDWHIGQPRRGAHCTNNPHTQNRPRGAA